VFNTVALQMADDVGIRTRQRVAIEFLGTESSSLKDIHRRLRSVYGEDAIDISSVRRRVRRFKSSEKDIGDAPQRVSNTIYVSGIERLTQRWKKSVDNEKNFVAK
jgi:hypothetical protein